MKTAAGATIGFLSAVLLIVAPMRPALAADADAFMIVDCLLPGDVRQLGSSVTYVTARKAVKTSARDCEIRGGEYVAHDRSSFASALKTWLPLAEDGDVEAMIYVGEIFERGLGLPSDPTTAAAWYEAAAEAGSARAATNLGALYERGAGVPRDLEKAAYWYRRAAGGAEALANLDQTRLVETLQGEVTNLSRELEETTGELERTRGELDRLRQEYERLRDSRREDRSQLDTLRRDLDALRKKAERQVGAEAERKLSEREEEVARSRAELARARAELAGLQAALREREAALEALKEDQTDEKTRKAAEIEGLRTQIAERATTLERLREELSKREETLAEVRVALADAQKARIELQERIAELTAAIANGEARLAEKDARIAELEARLSTLAEDESASRAANAAGIELIEPQLAATRGPQRLVLEGPREQLLVIGRVHEPETLSELRVNGASVPMTSGDLFRTEVTLPAPDGQIVIAALRKGGNADELVIEIKQREKLAAGSRDASERQVGLPVDPGELDLGRYYALVIGNNDYRMLPKLKTAVADANAVADLLERQYGFEVTRLINATRYDILSTLNTFRETLTPEDNLLIYYAGHGELDRVNSRGHWLPVDAEPHSTANWVSNIAVTDILNAMSVSQLLVIADSCYSGTLTRGSLALLEAGQTEEERLEVIRALARGRARMVLTSGGLEPVLDGTDGVHSIFARALLRALEANIGVLPGQDLHRVIAPAVTMAARQAEFTQVPEYAPIKFAGHETGDFLFVKASM